MTNIIFFLFVPKVSPIQLYYALLVFSSIFAEIYRELLFLCQKVTKEHRNTHKFVFFKEFEKRQILRNIWICLNNFFYQTSQMGEILTKTCFSPQSEPHTATLCFSVFWSILGETHRKLLFWSKWRLSQERAQKYSKSWFFLRILKWGKSWWKFWIF